jgi:heme-degrading monooxygenase HmoA
MTKARILNMVYSECTAENDARFNKWYNEVHIPLLFKYPGLKKVTRYQRMGDNREQAKYLAVYEYDTREELKAFEKSGEFKAAMAESQETWQGGGFEIKGTAVYEPVKTWEK